MMLSLLRFRVIILFIPCLFALTGCGSGEANRVEVIGMISGHVTMDDKPIPPGCVVIFNPVSGSGTIGSSVIDENGKYSASRGKLKGIPIGEYKVSISPPALEPKYKEELDKKNFAVVMEALAKRDPEIVKEKAEIPQIDIVPQSYWTSATSPLRATVKEGENTADFKLIKPEG